ncbi:unnamed protein product [Bursaphelenchus okinawaensis]|uniref:Protein kinase domain-containing protein n=1 Tax=Bursaphelenchus okinawaensis TaxID=465554 RepID=A0A811L191_9BILA|nr:unnamed protein product [Bursaphelenchus okinawaensis]CAG9116850.1 unnamed protein product [Bursaphelenchus okinawaensis]
MSIKAKPNIPTALDIVQLQKGDKVGPWEVIRKLGEGGFGAVYLVRAGSNAKVEFALKAEKASEVVKVLKMEVFVLGELKRKRAKHFCDLFDSGNIGNYNYVVMTLVGPSFHDLRKKYTDPAKQKFTLGCALSIGIKCVEAIEELHSVGYLHRDIKPGNFAVGKSDYRKVLMLDFGMARKFLDAKGEIRKPRWAAGFRGTVRYAPLSCHISREQCRKDDLETWMYMQIELTKGYLPWKRIENREEVGRCKDKCRNDNIQELFGGCPKEYIHILDYVDNLRYYDVPNYEKIRGFLRSGIAMNNVKEVPYDWEEKLKTEASENRTVEA